MTQNDLSIRSILHELGSSPNDQFYFFHSHNDALHYLYFAHYLQNVQCSGKNHILTAAENVALQPFELLGLHKKAVTPNAQGQITKGVLLQTLNPRVGMVSLSWADGLTGVIHPIADLGQYCQEKDVLLHVDASLMIGKHYFRFEDLPIHYLTFSGPKGCAGLLVKENAALNFPHYTNADVAAIAYAIAKANQLFDHVCLETARLRDFFERAVVKAIPEAVILFEDAERLPNCTAISFPGIHSEALLFLLSKKSIFASQSPQNSIFFSFSHETTQAQIEEYIQSIVQCVQKLQKISGALSAPLSTLPISWHKYSKKLTDKIENPRHGGLFTEQEAKERGMRLAVGKYEAVCLYWLVDESDGVIADAKFQVCGPSALMGAAQVACELLMRKNYSQAQKISADLLDRHVRDKSDVPAFPKETYSYLNWVLEAIELAAEQCLDIPFAESYVETPLDIKDETAQSYPGWELLTIEQKIAVIEDVIENEIRPYIELDAGGVQVLDLTQSNELHIAYQGACTSCHSAVGSTLNAIQEILRTKVNPSLVVIPDSSFLEFSSGQNF